MSSVTILTMCVENEDYCKRVAKRLGKESLYDVVEDDWRRPIIDGVLASVYFYSQEEVDWNKLRELLKLLGYEEMYEAIVKSMTDEVIEELEKRVKELLEQARKEIEELKKLL